MNITPDTLVWREGLYKWTPANAFFELQEIIKRPKHSSLDNFNTLSPSI